MTVGQIAVPIARALSQMAAHPAVLSLSVTATYPVATAELLVDVGLPSRWKAEGASPNGVRAVEPVTVLFCVGFPATAPRFFLRPDFDRSHPHIQPRSAVGLPEPCISAVAPDELVRARGIHGLLDQLALWLERAARVELIAPTQGWEPTRRDHIDDIVVVDTEWLPTLPKRDAETRVSVLSPPPIVQKITLSSSAATSPAAARTIAIERRASMSFLPSTRTATLSPCPCIGSGKTPRASAISL